MPYSDPLDKYREFDVPEVEDPLAKYGVGAPKRGLNLAPIPGALPASEVPDLPKPGSWLANWGIQGVLGPTSLALRGIEAAGKASPLLSPAGYALSKSPLRGLGADIGRFVDARREEQLGDPAGSTAGNFAKELAAEVLAPGMIAKPVVSGWRAVTSLGDDLGKAALRGIEEAGAEAAGKRLAGGLRPAAAALAESPLPSALPAGGSAASGAAKAISGEAEDFVGRLRPEIGKEGQTLPSRWRVGDDLGEAQFRKRVEASVAREGLDPKKVITWEETQRLADELGLDLGKISAKEVKAIHAPEAKAMVDVIQQNHARLQELNALDLGKMSPGARRKALDEMDQLERSSAAMLAKFIPARTQMGRDLNSLRMAAKLTNDPTLWTRKAEQWVGAKNLTDEARNEIVGMAARGDREGFIRLVQGLRETPVGQKLSTIWKANLLTGPLTHVRNITSTALNVAADTISRGTVGALADTILGTRTGRRTVARLSGDEWNAVAGGAKDGFALAKRIAKGELPPEALATLDVSRMTNYGKGTGGRIAQAYTDFIFNSLAAEDRLFRTIAYRSSLANQAKVAGLDVAKVLDDPPAEIAARAAQDALESIFQDRTALGEGLKGLNKMLNTIGSHAGVPLGEFIIPFSHTPGAVATRGAEYSPLGLAVGVKKAVQAMVKATGATEAEQREAAKLLGRGTLGTGVMSVGYYLASKGKASGIGDSSNPDERDRRRLFGTPAGAIKVGDTWLELAGTGLGPLAVALGTGATAYESSVNEGGGALGALKEGVYAQVKAQGEQPMFTGTRTILDAIRDPEGKGLAPLKNIAAAAVPASALLGAVARGVDPLVRKATTVGQAVQGRIPGSSQSLPAALDQLGREVPREGGMVDQLLNPLRRTVDKRDADPLLREIADLNAKLPREDRVQLNYLDRRVLDPWTGKKRELTEDEWRRVMKDSGAMTEQYMRKFIAAEWYKKMDAAARAKTLNEVRRKANEAAREKLLVGLH